MPNEMEAVIPQLLAQGLMALRTTCITPRLVNSDYDREGAQQGATIDVPVPGIVNVTDVVPGPNAPNTPDIRPTSVAIALDQWKEASFYLTDKDMKEVQNGTLPMQASVAIAAIADEVDKYVLSQYVDVYGFAGTAGTTPFSNGKTTDAIQAGKVLSKQLAPTHERRMILCPDAEANALDLRAFQDVSFSGSMLTIEEARIQRKLGFNWFMDQNVPTHVTSASLADWKVAAAAAKDVTSMTIKSGASAPAKGDIFTLAGQDQTYVVNTNVSNVITFAPCLQADTAVDTVLTFKATHTVNLAFQRGAIAFATRPLADQGMGLGSSMMSSVDPESGLTLRLEITREHKRVRFSYDMLYGARVVRPELIARLAG